MNRKKLLSLLFFLLPMSFLASAVDQTSVKTVNLKESHQSDTMQYTKELLIEAYALIGYEINWLSITSSKELELVYQGKLAAAIARHPVIESEFPELIRVPYKLFDFTFLKVSDRRRCGYCLDEDIHSIIYAKGARISEHYAKSLPDSIEQLAIKTSTKLNDMLLKRRVDSALIMGFQLSDEVIENPHMIIETITQEYDYHYLSPSFSFLKDPLINAFQQLEQNGTVERLRQKYHITDLQMLEHPPTAVSFTSGTWEEYSNHDGSGVYWGIVDAVFEQDFKMTKNTSIWARAIRSFEQGQVDVLVGAYKGDVSSDALYSSYHLDYEYPLYAYARNQEVIKRFKSRDNNLTACLNSGSSLNSHIDFIVKDNIIETYLEQCEVLIKNNKVDLVIDYDYNLTQTILALPKIELVENSPIFLVFHNTPKGHYLKKYFDNNIAKLAGSGALKKIFLDEKSYKKAHIRP